MADEKHSGGQNWLFGLDKLTAPTFDFLGIKLRDKLRAWLNQNARERALLRRFEKDFLYRHIDLLNYGNAQFSAMMSNASALMVERQFQNVAPVVKYAVVECGVPPDKAFDAVMKGFRSGPEEPLTLTGGEGLLYSAAASTFDVLLSFQIAQMLFHYSHAGSAFHLENPDAPDEIIERFMQDETTLHAISEAMETPGAEIAMLFAKALSEAYGQPFNESSFARSVAAADRQIAAESGEPTEG